MSSLRKIRLSAGLLVLAAFAILGVLACGDAEKEIVEVEKEVIKEVEVEVVVEKEVVVVVEGQKGIPHIITDPSAVPSTFNEAPMLAALVKAGDLPPVEERLPKEPLVIKNTDSIGRYGGTLRWASLGGAGWPGWVTGGLLYLDGDYAPTPHVAKGYEFSNNNKTLTLFLREGMRWSDGAPLTADDIIFWYEDVLLNEELTPFPHADYKGGRGSEEPGVWEKVDAYTVKVTFEQPYGAFAQFLGAILGGGHFRQGAQLRDIISPKHYMEQFHPKYAGQAEVDKMAEDEGFEDWKLFYRFKNDPFLNVESPVLTPWVMTVPRSSDRPEMERNPYYFGVDTEGNQLPYIDKMLIDNVGDAQVLLLRTADGNYDASMVDDVTAVPFLLENADKGGYTIRQYWNREAAFAGWVFNQTYDADPEIAKWIQNKDFRIALSIGFDRQEINEIFYLGLGEPGGVLPQSGPYYLGREMTRLYTRFDPDRANELLDSIGLDKKDSDGYRVRTDNGERLRIPIQLLGPTSIQPLELTENASEQWARSIGLDVYANEVAGSVFWSSHSGNDVPMWGWALGSTIMPLVSPYMVVPVYAHHSWGTLWAQYYATGGKEGLKPPAGSFAAINQDLFDKAKEGTFEESVPLVKEMLTNVAEEAYTIGTIVNLLGGTSATWAISDSLANFPQTAVMEMADDARRPPADSFPMQWYFTE